MAHEPRFSASGPMTPITTHEGGGGRARQPHSRSSNRDDPRDSHPNSPTTSMKRPLSSASSEAPSSKSARYAEPRARSPPPSSSRRQLADRPEKRQVERSSTVIPTGPRSHKPAGPPPPRAREPAPPSRTHSLGQSSTTQVQSPVSTSRPLSTPSKKTTDPRTRPSDPKPAPIQESPLLPKVEPPKPVVEPATPCKTDEEMDMSEDEAPPAEIPQAKLESVQIPVTETPQSIALPLADVEMTEAPPPERSSLSVSDTIICRSRSPTGSMASAPSTIPPRYTALPADTPTPLAAAVK